MSAVKGKNTKPEMVVRKYLHAYGLRYKLHDKNLPGKPDLVFPKRKTVIFVHGCFWHGHAGCKDFRIPKSRPEWWSSKIGGNITRDERNVDKLKNSGWNVEIIWECELSNNVLNELADKISKV